MNAKEANKILAEYEAKRAPAVCEEKKPACPCGWDGKVDWKASGQKCPTCGASLT